MVITRFAPSPTGELHLGHAYAAFFAQELAQKYRGQFLLRFEDIDHTRIRSEYYTRIEEDLQWLGLSWEQSALRQSGRLSAYQEALEVLKRQEVVYPCFCTRKEIEEEIQRRNGAPHGNKGLPYPGTCLHLSVSERTKRIETGHFHCWRLNASRAYDVTGPLHFHDHWHGLVGVDPDLLGDVVLARKDIATSYHLAVVVDDAFQKVTDVTRGEDLLSSTHVHRLLQELLALPEPTYHHHRLLTDEQGQRLAKRDQARSIRALRESGQSREDIRSLLTEK